MESKPTFCAFRRTSTAEALIQPTHVPAQNTRPYLHRKSFDNNIYDSTITIFMTLLSIFIADGVITRPTSVRFSQLLVRTAAKH